MYAIVKRGSTQLKVEKGQKIDIPFGSEAEGSEIELEALLLSDGEKVQDSTGKSVRAKVLGTVFGPKVVNFKYRRRHDSKRKVGHRQKYLRVEITNI